MLLAPLPLRVPEGVTDAVPRKSIAAAPPDGLGLVESHSLMDAEGVCELEDEPEMVRLALGDGELLPVELCDTERVAQ